MSKRWEPGSLPFGKIQFWNLRRKQDSSRSEKKVCFEGKQVGKRKEGTWNWNIPVVS